MGRGRCTFEAVDLTRAIKAVKKAGVDVARAEVARDGKIVLVLEKDDEPRPRANATSGMRSMARIKLKYVNGFSNRDRKSQRVRYYFRRRGIKAIALPGSRF